MTAERALSLDAGTKSFPSYQGLFLSSEIVVIVAVGIFIIF